jgi:metal-responsive CopG/Arc/MetJ family transcriptional regulator
MKVAVSIPDAVFAEAERLTKQLRTSRSEVYGRALSEFLGRHMPERVTELMNRVVAETGAESESFTKRAAHKVLENSEW